MVLTPMSEKVNVVGGQRTVGSPLVAWLVNPPTIEFRAQQNNHILHAVGIQLGATEVLCRACDHTTTRERDYDGTCYRYNTDAHLTIFCLINGLWMQGDVFVVKRADGWTIMPDIQRRDYGIGGKGIQLWPYTTQRNPNVHTGGEILAFVRSTGRVPRLFVERANRERQRSNTTTTANQADDYTEGTPPTATVGQTGRSWAQFVGGTNAEPHGRDDMDGVTAPSTQFTDGIRTPHATTFGDIATNEAVPPKSLYGQNEASDTESSESYDSPTVVFGSLSSATTGDAEEGPVKTERDETGSPDPHISDASSSLVTDSTLNLVTSPVIYPRFYPQWGAGRNRHGQRVPP